MLNTYFIPIYLIIDPITNIERQTLAMAMFDDSQWLSGLLNSFFQFPLLKYKHLF